MYLSHFILPFHLYHVRGERDISMHSLRVPACKNVLPELNQTGKHNIRIRQRPISQSEACKSYPKGPCAFWIWVSTFESLNRPPQTKVLVAPVQLVFKGLGGLNGLKSHFINILGFHTTWHAPLSLKTVSVLKKNKWKWSPGKRKVTSKQFSPDKHIKYPYLQKPFRFRKMCAGLSSCNLVALRL